MSKSIRIRTTPGGDDKYLKVNLEQDFDFLEILSLKLTQEEVYRQFYSDYGVVVGRVFCNGGLGIPNAKISVFVPLDANEREEIKELYPHRTIVTTGDDGVRYNLLPKDNQNDCHVPVGSFPSKREILDNDIELELFDKYYKYTTTTNKAGDFMIFGVPVGNHILNVDVDLSDIGLYSQKPYDMMEQGNPEGLFKSTTQFKGGTNLNNLTQIKTQQIGVNVLPFWGESQQDEVGISRVDVDLNYDIKPKAIFIGNMFGDTDKNSINKNCKARKKTGKICETVPVDGRFRMLRKRLDGEVESFNVEGGELIDDDGVWVFQIPMNLDYMITDEFGKLIPTEEPNKGIATRARTRFKIEPMNTGGEGRLRTRANFLIPHNPASKDDIDYEFGSETKESSFRDLYWNKIYTVKNFIPRFQPNGIEQSRKFVGFKDVDDCVGTKNPLPFNRLDKDFNPIYSVICLIMSLVVFVVHLLNQIITVEIDLPVIGKIRPFCGALNCIELTCEGDKYRPGCDSVSGECFRDTEGKNDGCGDFECTTIDCYQAIMAEALNVYELDFYNDWLNGSLYSLLVKYKNRKGGDKFCDVDDDEANYLMDSMLNDAFPNIKKTKINEGIIKKYKDELYYAPSTQDGRYRLLATDIVNLGTVNKLDWQGQPSIHDYLTSTSYQVPPFTVEDSEALTPMVDYGENTEGLLFDLTCLKVDVSATQSKNLKRICEIGVGLDEDRSDEPEGFGADGAITERDVENQFLRDAYILLNTPEINSLPTGGLTSNFTGSDYTNFRGYNSLDIPQPKNSFYFYFGLNQNKTAIEKMNKKYFEPCVFDNNKSYGDDTN